jgi:hypothetical protein
VSLPATSPNVPAPVVAFDLTCTDVEPPSTEIPRSPPVIVFELTVTGLVVEAYTQMPTSAPLIVLFDTVTAPGLGYTRTPVDSGSGVY